MVSENKMNKIIDRFSTLVSGYVNFLGRLPDWDGIANHFPHTVQQAPLPIKSYNATSIPASIQP
jgi:hypothetical protein